MVLANPIHTWFWPTLKPSDLRESLLHLTCDKGLVDP